MGRGVASARTFLARGESYGCMVTLLALDEVEPARGDWAGAAHEPQPKLASAADATSCTQAKSSANTGGVAPTRANSMPPEGAPAGKSEGAKDPQIEVGAKDQASAATSEEATCKKATHGENSHGETTYTVPLGSGLAALIPHGEGRPSVRWHSWADRMLEHLRDLAAARGTALEWKQATPPQHEPYHSPRGHSETPEPRSPQVAPTHAPESAPTSQQPHTAPYKSEGLHHTASTRPGSPQRNTPGDSPASTEADAGHWVEVRVVDAALPVDCLLGHPNLARILHTALYNQFGAAPAVYRQPGRLLACPTPHARPLADWTGPLDLASGYCQPLPPIHAPNLT